MVHYESYRENPSPDNIQINKCTGVPEHVRPNVSKKHCGENEEGM